MVRPRARLVSWSLLALALAGAAASAQDSDSRQRRRVDGRLAAPPAASGRLAREPAASREQAASYEGSNPYASAALKGRTPSIDAVREAPAGNHQIVGYAELAQRKMQLGDYAAALEPLSRWIALAPEDPEPYFDRAQVYNEIKEYDKALDDSKEGLRRAPQNALGWSQFAYASARQNSWMQALKAADEAVRLNPNDATGHYVRYLVAGHAGDIREALSALEWAARSDPRYGPLNERVRRTGQFVDPKRDSGAPAPAKRPWEGVPLWEVALGAALLFGSSLSAGVYSWLKYVRNKVHGIELASPAFAVGLPGRRKRMIGKYEVSHMIGRGGMGDVYQATDMALERPVAIKRISDQLKDLGPRARAMLIQEAKVVASLHHPAIVDIYEILEDGKDVYLVFEFVKGQTAHQLLAERGRLPLMRAGEILRPVCNALHFAHGHGLVHRDLKPGNIMVTDDGYVKLMDFGIARSLLDASAVQAAPAPAAARPPDAPWARPWGQTQAQSTSVVGTPSYMAPEMESGVVSRQGDVYALGICLYELVTGRVPFTSPDQKLRLDYKKARELQPALPAQLDELIAAALQPDPKLRLQSPREFGTYLDALAGAATQAPGARPAPGQARG